MIGTISVSDAYMEMLGTLPNEDKLDLISKLIKSMKKAVTTKKEPKNVFARFSTDWGGDMATEDYAEMLRRENVGATAVHHQMTLVSSNLKHFERIQGLELDNWK